MDIEKLNKSQIVLLTLLVSFMTSIATGIVTVSLMQQAPPAITQTVSKVIEHTIEKVVPGQAAAAAAAVPPSDKPIVIRESDLISQAVAKITPSIVRVYSGSTSVGADTPFLGLGVVLADSGMILTDAGALGDSADALVELEGGTRVRAFVTSRDSATGVLYLAATSTADGAKVTWVPAVFATAHPTLGETAIMLSGRSTIRLGAGLISAISALSKDSPDGILETNIAADGILPGSPLIDDSGAILGVSTSVSSASSPQGFIAAAALSAAMKETGPEKQ